MEHYVIDDEQEIVQEPEYASFWVRAGAYLLDALIFIPVSLLSNYNAREWQDSSLMVLLILCFPVYKVLMEWKLGATLGKLATRIRVRDFDTGGTLSLSQSLKRFTFYGLSVAVNLAANLMAYDEGINPADMFNDFYTNQPIMLAIYVLASVLVLISILMIFWDPKQRAMHDKVAGTMVVKV